MLFRKSSAPNEKPSDAGLADQRFETAGVEERDMAVRSTEADMSQVSTLDGNQNPTQPARAQDSVPSSGTSSEWMTPSSSGSSQPTTTLSELRLRRNSSNVMQVKKETHTKLSKYPKKGYKVTTKFFYEEIDGHWTAALLVVCFFVAGCIDSVTFQVFSVFTSLQTGNTVFLALRLSGQGTGGQSLAYIKQLVSLGSYCLGGLFFNVLHKAPSGFSSASPPLHRWTLFTSFFIQSCLLLISAALAQSGWVSANPFVPGSFPSGLPLRGEDHYYNLIPISFLAFESAGQVCLSRVLTVNELPTIVISTLYHDFIADALSWRRLWRTKKSTWSFIEGQKRQARRISCIFALFAGAIVGGFVHKSRGGLAAALWISAGVKAIVCLAWCLWKRKVVVETVVTRGGGQQS